MFTNYPVNHYPYEPSYTEEDRFFLAPFLIGGLAGTALGYGIANNNQQNNYPYPMVPMYYSYPIPMMPSYSTSNYYY